MELAEAQLPPFPVVSVKVVPDTARTLEQAWQAELDRFQTASGNRRRITEQVQTQYFVVSPIPSPLSSPSGICKVAPVLNDAELMGAVRRDITQCLVAARSEPGHVYPQQLEQMHATGHERLVNEVAVPRAVAQLEAELRQCTASIEHLTEKQETEWLIKEQQQAAAFTEGSPAVATQVRVRWYRCVMASVRIG
jgi:hypothetical protein